MKTKVYILTILLALDSLFLSAGGPEKTVIKSSEKSITISSDLGLTALSMKKEANITDCDMQPATSMVNLAPETPMEAPFDETGEIEYSVPVSGSLRNLAPTTPKEADFQEELITYPDFIAKIAPVAPMVARFDE